MSAEEIIERIKELPANERAQVLKFVAENSRSLVCRAISLLTADDGLPLIRAGGTMTSQMIREIESRVA